MTTAIEFGVIAFSSLISMINPVSAAPIFLVLTESEAQRRRAIALRATFAAMVALVLFWGAGNFIFKFFGITVPAFQIVGGLMFLLSSLKALQGDERKTEEAGEGDPSVVPIGIPLLAGAGALSTVMVLAGQARQPQYQLMLGLAIAACMVLTFATLATAPKLLGRLGKSGTSVLNSVMHLLTAVIGAQFIINGVTGVIESLR